MSRLRAEFLYEVGHLWLCAEALGASVTFDRDGLQVEIAMPRERTQFSDRVRNDDWFWVALTGTTAGPLFQARNAVAHSGKLPSEWQAREFAEIARAAFAWLGSVELDAHLDQTDTVQKSGH